MRTRICFLSLLTAFLIPSVQADQVIFSEIMYHPAGDLPEYLEVGNVTATPLDLAEWRLRGGVDYDFPPFSAATPAASFLKPYERILLCGVDPAVFRAAYAVPASVRIFGPWTGQLDNAGERIELKDKNGVNLCAMTYNDRGHWPPAADGAGHSLAVINPDASIDDWRNWRASARRGGTPGTEPVGAAETAVASPEVNLSQGIPFVDYGDTWKFNDQAVDLGTAWRAPGYSDTAWPQGPGLLGFEESSLPAPGLRTAMADHDQLTFYLRRHFTYSGSLAGVTLTLDQILDDGAIYYLNGQELGRSGMGAGTIAFTTASSRTVGNAIEELNVITTTGSALVQGDNVLAVEAHQNSSASSDIVFGCRLKVSVPNQNTVVLNEVYPAPAGAGFVEFFNPTAAPINLRNHYLSDSPARLTQYRITADLIIAPGGLASVGFSESGLAAGSPLTVYLTAPDGVTALSAISTSASLAGRSIGRKPAGGSSWFLFVDPTRDQPNQSQSSMAAALHLSEIHFSPSNTVDWVELYNSSTGAVALTGLALASRPDLTDRLPLTGSIPAGGYGSCDAAFAAGNGELTLFLVGTSDTILAAQRFAKTAQGDALQAFPAGATEWYGTALSSRDAPNNPPRSTDIVINEIMYDPPSDEVAGEFIELYNRGSTAVDVSRWRFSDGIDFTVPAGTVIPAGGYLVIAADADWMRATYGPIPVVGNFSGRLRNTGDLLRLVDAWGNLTDQVDYRPGGQWPGFANGGGTSMELRNPWMDNTLPSAWADSNETNKTAFKHYSYTDVYAQLRADGVPTDYKELHLHLVGDSHVVLRNIQVRQNGAGANLLLNSDRMSGDCCSASGWLAQGTHYASFFTNGELHLRADGHGDNRPNRVEIDATGMQSGQPYEISFDARWVLGSPRLIAQTWDHSIATSVALEIPATLGTPGALNSQFAAAVPPQVDALRHSPPVPAPGQVVTVTARITSAVPGVQVRLYHRPDSNTGDTAWSSKLMADDGVSGGDSVATDGVYSAQLTEYPDNGDVVQFYVRASAGAQTSQAPKGGPDRPALYVVDTPSAPGDLRQMRLVVSAFDLRTLSNQDNPTGSYGYKFPRLSNHYFNMTLIVNEQTIIYNGEVRTSGSPWTRGGDLSRGKFKLPKDQLFRGKEKLMYDNDAGGDSRHHNRIVRYWLYLLGHPVNENEYVQIEVNNLGPMPREEVEPVGNDLLDRNFANGSQGELYRIDDEWWFQDNWSRNQRDADWVYKGTDNAGRYRTEWIKRSREDDDDFSALVGFFKKLTLTYTQSEIERLIDPDLTMKMCAVRGYVYDWDSFSLSRGKNGYFYRKSTDGRFMFWHWDSDLAFQDANNIFYSGKPGFPAYFAKSYNFRLFKHYLARLVEEFTRNSPRIAAWLQAEEEASSQYPVSGAYQTWFSNRETPALNLLGAARTQAFAVTSGGGSPINTSAATIGLNGNAPLRVYRVEVAGHPEAVFTWSSDLAWSLTGIRLHAGTNLLTVNAVDEAGHVFHTQTVTVNKSGNAPPVARLEADPNSWHVPVIAPLYLDARGSEDPEGGPLAMTWSATPADAQLDASRQDEATVLFPRPGLYTINLTVTDTNGAPATIQREAAVYAPDGFSPFNTATLDSWWNRANVQARLNSVSSAWYSLSEVDGRLVLHVLDDAARPFAAATPRYPLLWRALPAQTDWALLTQVEVAGQVFGDYFTGLQVETVESGSSYRYAFGIEDGGSLSVKRVNAAGSASALKTVTLSETEVAVRIRRAGNALYFERLTAGTWTVVHSTGIAAGSTTLRGGIFLATDVAQNNRAMFDYVVLVDPAATSELREHLRISEIMYNPEGGSAFEYVELVNTGEATLDLTGVQFTAGIDYTFGHLLLAPRQYVVVVSDPVAFATRYQTAGLNIAPGAFTGKLDNAGETLELSDAQGIVIFAVTYRSASPWPTAADGSGSSLEAVDPTGNLNDPAQWRASPEPHGSPGRPGGISLGTVIVNEVLTHTDPPLEDAIELYNRTAAPIDISGWFLSDARDDLKRFRIPQGTVLPARGYHVFYEVDFNTNSLVPFALSSAQGDQVFLSAADAAGNLTGYQARVEFGPAANGVAFGRYETSLGRVFTAMANRTFGADTPATIDEFRLGAGQTNAAPRVGPVVFNELMYHPPDVNTNDNTLAEFIELHNVTASAVPLFDPMFPTNTWRLRGGVAFDLPTNLTVAARGCLLLVSFDPATNAAQLATFRTTYSIPATVPICGPYSGKLQNAGELVSLAMPDPPQGPGPDQGLVPYVLVDEVRYEDVAPWPEGTDGTGQSLQRRRPWDYGNDPVNWKAALPTAGRANVAGSTVNDRDGDGLPDEFEQALGLNPDDPADARADADGDGVSNESEYLAGTSPTNAAEFVSPPQIGSFPTSREAGAGENVVFNVSVQGSAPFQYQWRKDGLAMVGATNAALVLTNVQSADSAEYQVVVRNDAGFALSEACRLQVNQPLQIIAQPLSQFADVGGSVTLSVIAAGTGSLRYQWLRDGAPIAGETNASLTLVSAQPADSGNYAVTVSDALTSLTSASATVSVLIPPTIAMQPQSQTVIAYATVYFTVTAGGQGPFAYQWRFNGVNIPGATNQLLWIASVQPSQAGAYSVQVLNPVGSALSSNATLTVRIPATILQQPSSQAVDPGATVTFTVTATSSSPMTYQWRFNDQDIPGATGSSLTLAHVQDAQSGNYQVIVTDSIGSVASDVALLTVLSSVEILNAPVNLSVVEGGTAVFSVETTGALPIGYRWKANYRNVTNYNAFSRKSFLTVPRVTTNDAGTYQVIISNILTGLPGLAKSKTATLTVLADTDRDGMPDAWETQYGLRPLDPADAAADPDLDGASNLEEYGAGTNPTNALSHLRLEARAIAGAGGALRFEGVSNRTYTVEYMDTVQPSLWLKLDDLVAQPTNRVEVLDDHRAAPRRFYRLVTPRQPDSD